MTLSKIDRSTLQHQIDALDAAHTALEEDPWGARDAFRGACRAAEIVFSHYADAGLLGVREWQRVTDWAFNQIAHELNA